MKILLHLYSIRNYEQTNMGIEKYTLFSTTIYSGDTIVVG